MNRIGKSWNPHIIENLRKKEELNILEELLFEKDQINSIKTKFLEFRSKILTFPSELFSLSDNYFEEPFLAYRLDPILSKPLDLKRDVINASKFGGFPDMTWWVNFLLTKNDEIMYDTIDQIWPQCCCCHNPLRFLGQMDLSDWVRAIHLATYKNTAEDPQKHQIYAEFQESAFGTGNHLGFNYSSANLWYYFFYCDCYSFDKPAPSAAVILKRKHKNIDVLFKSLLNKKGLENIGINPDKIAALTRLPQKQLDPQFKSEYIETLKYFMKKHDIYPDKEDPEYIKLQFINNFDLQFEIDSSKDFDVEIPHPPYTDYTLFGRPKSRQEEPRFMCPYGYDNVLNRPLHRQASIIRWDNKEQDITHQMYGCFLCSYDNITWAKMDSSMI